MTAIDSFFQSFLKRIEQLDWLVFEAIMDNGEAVFEYFSINPTDKANVLIIYGENTSGKSLLSNIIEIEARDKKIAARSASMKNRTKGGVEKALIVGDEQKQSTGATSISFAEKSLNSTIEESDAALSILDEPDLGLSDYYSGAFGQFIGQKTQSFDNKKGLVLISHSKELIRHFLETTDQKVSTLGINTVLSLNQWLADESTASIDELKALNDKASKKKKAILQTMKNK